MGTHQSLWVPIITKTCLFKCIENFTPKNWIFSDKKNSDNLHISAKNIDCGYSLEVPWRGGSNEYPQSTFSSRNKKNNVYPCKPQFYYIKVGFNGGQNYIDMFSWCNVSFHSEMWKYYIFFFFGSKKKKKKKKAKNIHLIFSHGLWETVKA